MRRSLLFALVLTPLFAVPLFAQEQQEQSLGDIARKTRKAKEERDKSAAQPKKVFTDENMASGASSKADLGQLDNPDASPAERLATARRMIARAEDLLDKLAPMDRVSLAKLVLEGQDVDFPGRRAWEEKLFSAKEHYVSHGRDLFRETKDLLNNMESLTSGGKVSPTDPKVTEISHRALQLMQDANRTDADFQAILLEGQDLAKKAIGH